MDNTVVVALGIAVVGMSLLFLSLLFFYGLLTLITKMFQDRTPEQVESAEEHREETGMDEAIFQAAALAVALARAELEQAGELGGESMLDSAAGQRQVSSWWTLHHQRQLTPNPKVRRAQ